MRASKFVDSSIFGNGVYTASKAPHTWTSKEAVLLNNYLPAKAPWEERKEEGWMWPDDKLYANQTELQPEQEEELLRTGLGTDLLSRRAKFSDCCVAIVCDSNQAKDMLARGCDVATS